MTKKAISFVQALQNTPEKRVINGQDQKIEAAALKARPDFEEKDDKLFNSLNRFIVIRKLNLSTYRF